MGLSTKEKIGGAGIIAVLTLLLSFSGEARGWLSFLHPTATPLASTSSSLTVQAPPKKAELTLQQSPQRVLSASPLVLMMTLIITNSGDGSANDVVLSCGILDDEFGSHAKLPPIAAHDHREIALYLPKIQGDFIHEHDSIYCSSEPVISYRDESGKHKVYFDLTGQANEHS